MSEKKKEKKQKKKKGHTLYALTVLILGIAIIVMTVLLVFHVQTIEIAGNEYVSTGEIAESVQADGLAKNSLYVIGRSMLGKIEFPKAVESAKIRMTAPWSIKVTVKEKKIIAYTIAEDEYVYFGEDGTVLLKSAILMEDIPCIEGMEVSDAKLYKILPVEEKRLFRNISDAVKAWKACEITPERIVSAGADLTIYIGDICVELGSGDMELKIRQIPMILEKLEGKTGTLDLKHYNGNSEIISFKEGELPKTDEE